MMTKVTTNRAAPLDYNLEKQVGFLLRQVNQRHAAIFQSHMGEELTPTQWSMLVRLSQEGPCSQNQLGRLIGLDAPTTNGVVRRLSRRGLLRAIPDAADSRKLVLSITAAGRTLLSKLLPVAHRITAETLAPLNAREQRQFLAHLQKVAR